ncbi:unnamed protein product [Nezara viridula]|uniref:Uncharacterized protein n=1 Tax=Nezara viridula TaxID=85310 RepID=A0A9P0HTK4_NEZVI|nr:unnamed protein product [Nezara viridula]
MTCPARFVADFLHPWWRYLDLRCWNDLPSGCLNPLCTIAVQRGYVEILTKLKLATIRLEYGDPLHDLPQSQGRSDHCPALSLAVLELGLAVRCTCIPRCTICNSYLHILAIPSCVSMECRSSCLSLKRKKSPF